MKYPENEENEAPSRLRDEENEELAPLPMKELFSIACVIFTLAFCMLIIEPLFPFMALELLPGTTPTQVGYYSGILFSSLPFGNLIGSIILGYAADRYGRRPILILGSTIVPLFCLLFGLSENFWFACGVRVFWGLFLGTIPVARSTLGELIHPTRRAEAFSVIGLSFGVGRSIGPFLGGYLANPADKWEWANIPLFQRFHYLLPTMAAAAICSISALSVWLFVPETLHRRQNSRIEESSSTNTFYKMPEVWLAWLTFCFNCTYYYCGATILPIWGLNSPQDFGLSFTPADVGIVVGISAIFTIYLQMKYFPPLTRALGLFKSFVLLQILCVIGAATYPFATFLSSHSTIAFIWVSVFYAIYQTAASCTNTCSLIFIDLCTSRVPDSRGKVNAFGQLFGDTGRMLSPTLVSAFFAVLMGIDTRLFWVCNVSYALFAVIAVGLVVNMPPWMNTKSEEKGVELKPLLEREEGVDYKSTKLA